MHIRLLIPSDCLDLYNWFNDPLTREMSHQKNQITIDEHKKWFSSVINNKNILIYICEEFHNKNKIGVIRFNISLDRALISINLSPSIRGKGYSEKFLRQSIKFFSKSNPLVTTLIAEIKSENLISKRLFNKVGFIHYKIKNNINYYILNNLSSLSNNEN